MKLLQLSLRMILGNLKQCSFPSMAHVVLGFPVRNGFVESALGASGMRKAINQSVKICPMFPDEICMAISGSEAGSSSLGRLLEQIEAGRSLYEILPTTSELALDILDCLCQHQKTGAVVLDFIRGTWAGDLSVRGLVQQLPLVNPSKKIQQFLPSCRLIFQLFCKQNFSSC